MKLDIWSEGQTIAQNMSKLTVLRQNRMMLYLGQYSILHGDRSLMGQHFHRPINWQFYISSSRDIQKLVHHLKSNVQLAQDHPGDYRQGTALPGQSTKVEQGPGGLRVEAEDVETNVSWDY